MDSSANILICSPRVARTTRTADRPFQWQPDSDEDGQLSPIRRSRSISCSPRSRPNRDNPVVPSRRRCQSRSFSRSPSNHRASRRPFRGGSQTPDRRRHHSSSGPQTSELGLAIDTLNKVASSIEGLTQRIMAVETALQAGPVAATIAAPIGVAGENIAMRGGFLGRGTNRARKTAMTRTARRRDAQREEEEIIEPVDADDGAEDLTKPMSQLSSAGQRLKRSLQVTYTHVPSHHNLMER